MPVALTRPLCAKEKSEPPPLNKMVSSPAKAPVVETLTAYSRMGAVVASPKPVSVGMPHCSAMTRGPVMVAVKDVGGPGSAMAGTLTVADASPRPASLDARTLNV